MSNHPIIPPPELVEQWWDAVPGTFTHLADEMQLATAAAQWGADQELEACLLWVGDGRRENLSQVIELRNARRPEPPTLKEQALKGFDDMSQFALGELEGTSDYGEYKKIADTVREALESL